MRTIYLVRAAWHGDVPYAIQFPDNWDVTVVGGNTLPALTKEEIRRDVAAPIASPPLSVLASGRRSAAIIVDDLSRPTPAASLIAVVLEEIFHAGIRPENVTLFIAGGTHAPASEQQIAQKSGPLPAGVRVCSHDCRGDMASLGKSKRGTPVLISRAVMACDLKIGIASIYPHPAAGFSGGSKILVPGMAGFETIRYMHDHLRGAEERGGELDNEFRLDIEDNAEQAGLDFVVNVVLNQERRIAALGAGDPRQALRRGVEMARQLYSCSTVQEADIVVADMYPFDTTIEFAHDRGMWPLYAARPNASKVILAACPEGVGNHALYPIRNSLQTRILRRLKHFRLRDIPSLPYRLKAAVRLVTQKPRDVLMLSEGIGADDFRIIFPGGRNYQGWEELLADLQARHAQLPVRVAVYRCAPFLLPRAPS